MQALSIIVHIPLVCFGIAFPAMILFIEWRYLRTGDELFGSCGVSPFSSRDRRGPETNNADVDRSVSAISTT